MNNSILFFNRCFDKKRLKNFLLWFFSKYGERATIQLIESLKDLGFQYATKAGVSIGIDDLQIPFIKSDCINLTEKKIKGAEVNYQRGNITEIERQQQFVDEWSFVSEKLKRHVIQFFKATDVFNPIYMMAFSGARGNISQIRQLIGMRGLMADPQGQILDFPIRSSFREGLTLTEYLISCYGARKGVVDTALRTATSGYLTRRLVDVTQQVVIGRQNCYTTRGVQFTNLMDGTKTLLSLKDRLIGRILLDDIFITDPFIKKKLKIGFKNQEISPRLSRKIYKINNQAIVRSPLTCQSKNSVCQLCYGWNLAYNALVSIGEAVGVLAAQSIGEPGTQLTMRTFHTGGVFTGGLIDQIYAPFTGEVNYINNFKGVLIRTLKGRIGFLTKTEGALQVKTKYVTSPNQINSDYKRELTNLFFSNQLKINSINRSKIHSLLGKILATEKILKRMKNIFHPSLVFNIPIHTILFTRNEGLIFEKELIAELSSISISDSRRQETEQEVFAPIEGQIFFENLVLIEKTKRDGSIQKMTYGLGSLWVVSAVDSNSLVYPHVFQSHGDFISSSSVIQKLQILAEKFYYFDKSARNSIQNFRNFKAASFLANPIPGEYFKPRSFDTILLNRTFYLCNFLKIYYKSFRYCISIKNTNNFLNTYLYSKKNNLLIRAQLRKNKRPKIDLNYLILSLNFNFYQTNPIFRIHKQKSKSNLSLYSIQNNTDQSKGRLFFSLVSHNPRVKPKLKKPIASRKIIKFSSTVLKKKIYQYWSNYYSLLDINLGPIFSKIFWTFSKKKLYTSFDFVLPRRDNNFSYLYDYFFKVSKLKNRPQNLNAVQIQQYKVSRFFFANLVFYSFFLCFSSTKNLHKYNWVSTKQTTSLLANRQSIINFQLSKLWYLSNEKMCRLYPNYSKTSTKKTYLVNFNTFKKLSPYIFLGEYYIIKPAIKPILINPGLLVNIYNKKFYIHCYIIQNFLISFYYDYFSSLKFDNYFFNSFKKNNKKIGFQAQFKVSIIPTFPNIKIHDTKFLSKIKKIFLKNQVFTFLKKNNLLNINYKKQQNDLSWPCTYRKKLYIEYFGYFLNFGTNFKRKNFFDRQQIIVDILYNKVFCKFNLLTFFSYKNFHKLRIRFCAHRLLSKNLIIFQKIEKYKSINSYYFKVLNLNKNYKNHEYHNPLGFNFLKNYFIKFNKCLIEKNSSFHLLYFDNPNIVFNKKIFLKTSFIQIAQVKAKTLANLNYRILLKSYIPLRKNKKGIKKFRFYEQKGQTNEINSYIFNNLICFGSKAFSLSSIKKFDFQVLLNKKINPIKIFYKRFDHCSIKDLIHINFFSASIDSEVIYTNPKKHELGQNFIALTQSNLRAFILGDQRTTTRLKNLMLSNFLRYGTIFENQKTISNGGQIIYIDKKSFTIRTAIPFLITSKSLINVSQDELIKQGSRLFTFLSYQVKTGDIIQGIPKIEEFFEARLTREGLPLLTNLHTQIKQLFQNYSSRLSIFEATQKSFEKIQYLIIDEIQKVYCSQGIYIADKHLEIVVRQMTAKVQIRKGGKTGLLCGELVELDWVRLIEQRFGSEEIAYEPIILGITKSCLETESFISAASFQETTRILTKAAIQNKIDFIRGLKQNVILGNLVPAGTGFFSPLYLKYSKVD